jgi:hypothetical protein
MHSNENLVAYSGADLFRLLLFVEDHIDVEKLAAGTLISLQHILMEQGTA